MQSKYTISKTKSHSKLEGLKFDSFEKSTNMEVTKLNAIQSKLYYIFITGTITQWKENS
jgi:hypothetical protein